MKKMVMTSMLVMLMAVSVQAGPDWSGTTGDWSTGSNWSTGNEPNSGNWTHIDNGGTAQVTASDEVSGRLYLGEVSGESGTVDINGGSLAVTDQFYVGGSGTGTMDIRNGGTANNGAWSYIGQNSTGTGTVTIDGSNSKWTISNVLVVGNYGTGILYVQNAGEFSASSQQLYVGNKNGGTGTLNITFGGTVSNGTCNIGANAGSTGVVTVDGAGSTWMSSTLFIGRSGTGTLNITDGGLVVVATALTIDDNGGADSFVYMKNSAMLAINAGGDVSANITTFLTAVSGTDAIKCWDWGTSAWDDITNGTEGSDYTLEYHTAGDLTGYTMLIISDQPAGTLIIIQ